MKLTPRHIFGQARPQRIRVSVWQFFWIVKIFTILRWQATIGAKVCQSSPAQQIPLGHGCQFSRSEHDYLDGGPPLPIEHQFTRSADGFVSLMGKLTAFVSYTTMALV